MRLKADLLLVLVTFLWGSAFAVMRLAAGHGSIFLLNGARFLLGGLLLLPWAKIAGAYDRKNFTYVFLAGFALFAAVGLQQAGLETTTAGNGGFITCLYVVIVPFILWIGWRERPAGTTIAAAVMAVAGTFLLSTGGSLRIGVGDVYIFFGAFFWAMHVVVVGRAQPWIRPLPFAFGQYMVCGLLNLVAGGLLERPTAADALYLLPAIVYTGVFSITVGFTLQIFAQNHTPANDAALILSLEAVTAAIFGWAFLGERLGPVQLAGCGLITVAVLLVQFRNARNRAVTAPAD